MEVLGGGQAAARDLDARSEAAIRYLVGLSTVGERRAATAVPWPQLLAAVRVLAGCQRCGFVPSVVAAFCPELAAALDPPLSTNSRSGGLGSGGGGQGVLDAAPAAELLFPGRSGDSSGTPAGLLAPAQLLALLDNNSGGGGAGGSGSDLVSLLQFAWRGAAGVDGAFAAASAGDVTAAPDQDISGAAAHGGRAGGGPGAASEGFGAGAGRGDSDGVGLRRLALNDQLLGKSRLLRRFLSQSLQVMEALSEDVGDCRRHVGYPGPAELASTLSRLELQRAHTLERLAAWGVLRPPEPQAAMAAAATPADAAAGADAATVGSRGQRQSGRGGGSRVVPAAVGTGGVGGADAGEVGEDVAGDEVEDQVEQETDLELAVAIQLSLQEASAAAAVVVEATTANGDVLEPGVAEAQRTLGRGALGAEGCAPRTPTSARTRPAATAATPSAAGTADLGAGREAEAGGRSPAPPASGGRGTASGRPRPLGESVEGLAAYGLADDGQSGDGHPHSGSLGPDPRRLPSAVPATSLTSGQHAARHASAATADGHPAMGAPAATASGPLSVSAASAAAAGLEDAAVLVDTAAVAALPPSLRERVEQLVCQLMQVQQRRTRLQHACQHSIIAAGRKLLLILLQQLWAELLQAADRAAGAAAATVVEEATAAAESRVFTAPAASLEGLAAELAGGVPQRAASATERSGARAAAAAAAATGRALGGLAGARSAPSPLPPAVSPSPAGSVGAAVSSVSPGAASTARRQPRYAGRLADLAEGLGDEETHLDLDSLDPDSELNRNLDPAGRGLLGLPEISDLESVLGDVARLREREGRAGRHGGGGAGGVGFGGAGLSGRSFPGGSYGYNNDDDDRQLQLHTWHGRSAADASGSAGEEGEGEDVVGGGWDDTLRVSPSARLRLSSTIGAFGGSSSSGSGSAGARDALSNRLRQSSAPAPDHGATTDLLGSGGRAAAATATTAALLSAALPSIGGHDRAGRRSLSVAFPSSSSADAGAGAGVTAAATAAVRTDSSAGARPPRGAAARRSMAALWESTAGMGLAGGSSSGLGSNSRATATDSNAGAAAAGELDQRHSAPADREARISRILNRSSVASSSCGMLGIRSGAGGGGLGGACGTACVAARAEQAEQLQVLQGQLCRCQQSQSELQREVGRLLDQMAGSRRAAEQATAAVRRELAQWQGDAQALQGLGPEALTELAGRMEAALSRVRAAALAAAAERDHQCPVCWEARKGLVFGCGHQTCVDCGEKLAACPICREPVALRIRVYG